MFRDRDQHPALSLRTSLDLEMSPNQSQETNQESEASEKAGDSERFAIKITEMCRSAWLMGTRWVLAPGHRILRPSPCRTHTSSLHQLTARKTIGSPMQAGGPCHDVQSLHEIQMRLSP